MTLDEALASAYHRDQVERRRSEAVSQLRAAFTADPALATAGRAKLVALRLLLQARSERADHIGATMAALLSAALGA